MNWQQVCEEPSLQDLPFKIELNEYGQVVMSPASNEHGRQQARLIILMTQHLPEGEVISECSIHTSKGVKVADVVWTSVSFIQKHGYATPYLNSPEICIEISSPSNSDRELSAKLKLYFEQGAKEVWICDSFGNLDFYDLHGSIPVSKLAAKFPDRI
jgi:Uma2 family endonuclease